MRPHPTTNIPLITFLLVLVLGSGIPVWAPAPATASESLPGPVARGPRANAAASVVFRDDFNDDAIDSRRWNAIQIGTGPTVAETNQRLEITIPASSANDATQRLFGAGYTSKCQLRGDFDVQTDYNLIDWPFSNGVRVGLFASPTGRLVPSDRVERVSFGSSTDYPDHPREVYLADFPLFSSRAQGITATDDLSGTLRLVRSGSTVTAFYYDSGHWVSIFSGPAQTSDAQVGLMAWSDDQVFTYQTVKMAFDNFVVSQGRWICPGTDSDGDGLLDDWEANGFDSDGDGTIDEDLPAMGADPNKKDIFIEVDWMEQDGLLRHSHKPRSEAMLKVFQAFWTAPVDEIENYNLYRGINLHVDVGPDSTDYVTGEKWGSLARGNPLEHREVIGENSRAHTAAYDLAEANMGHDPRVFRYALFVHRLADPHPAVRDCVSGLAWSTEEGGEHQVFVVSLGGWPGPACELNPRGVGTWRQQAGVFMHELGHTLGLQHGGDTDVNHKPNYLSVMNHSFMYSGLIVDGNDAHFDYSRFKLPDLEEASLSELDGLEQRTSYGTKHFCGSIPDSTGVLHFVDDDSNDGVDWNCNGRIAGTGQADINGDGRNTSTLTGYNDWARRLTYKAGCIGQVQQCELSPPQIPSSTEGSTMLDREPTAEEALRIQQIGDPRVRLVLTAVPTSTHRAGTISYSLAMTNIDKSDAEGVNITVTLPRGFSYQIGSTSGATTEEPAINGRNLAWGPFTVPADGGTLTLTFRVTTASTPDTYFSSVSGRSTNGIVVPTGDTAEVTVRAFLELYLPLIQN